MEKYSKLGRSFTPKQKLIMMLTQVSHDMGYTSRLGTYGFEGTKLHPFVSEIMAGEQKTFFEELVGAKGLEQIKVYIRNHDETSFITDTDENLLGSIIKLSDNIALFSYEKLPEIFAKNPKGLRILGLIQLAKETGVGKKTTKALKIELKHMVDAELKAGRISIPEASYLKNAIGEIFHKSGEFSLGMIGGRYGADMFHVTEEGGNHVLQINLEESMAKDLIEKAFDSDFRPETSQFLKMINDYRKFGAGLKPLSAQEFKAKIKKDGYIEFKVGETTMKINVSPSTVSTKIDLRTAKIRLADVTIKLKKLQSQIKQNTTRKLLLEYENLLIIKNKLSEQIAIKELVDVKTTLKSYQAELDSEMKPIMDLSRRNFEKMTFDQRMDMARDIRYYIQSSKIKRNDPRREILLNMVENGLGISNYALSMGGTGGSSAVPPWKTFRALRNTFLEQQQKLQEKVLVAAAA